eukprot:gnl/MRDRNA2_/MRDRNA2_59606_c0_seq1.p1 gnl/MRDRNA2_/MRDRNA2_59606_c0~~gnl/MRDRNA2_/MRDRNA2_59606_c0_seq1.p1  ORF type:complete len:157 (+),score=41.62 gnl/MRDRNA2_/MRDRNA2_59606_c0_seq1:141-611(+)
MTGKSKAQITADVGMQAFKTGDSEKAVTFFEKALPIAKEDKDNTLIVTLLMNLGVAKTVLGDMNASVSFLEQAVEVQERSLGPDHPDLVETLQNLVVVHTKLGNTTKAAECMERAGKIEALREPLKLQNTRQVEKPGGAKVEELESRTHSSSSNKA